MYKMIVEPGLLDWLAATIYTNCF